MIAGFGVRVFQHFVPDVSSVEASSRQRQGELGRIWKGYIQVTGVVDKRVQPHFLQTLIAVTKTNNIVTYYETM